MLRGCLRPQAKEWWAPAPVLSCRLQSIPVPCRSHKGVAWCCCWRSDSPSEGSGPKGTSSWQSGDMKRRKKKSGTKTSAGFWGVNNGHLMYISLVTIVRFSCTHFTGEKTEVQLRLRYLVRITQWEVAELECDLHMCDFNNNDLSLLPRCDSEECGSEETKCICIK